MTDKNLEEVFVTENHIDLHPPSRNGGYNMKTDYLHLGHLDPDWKDAVLLDGCFVPRWMAEKDRTILQIIPYVICCTKDTKILTYNRKGGGEGRLEGKKSIGIGGHVNKNDLSFENDYLNWGFIVQGAIRELREELTLDYTDDMITSKLTELGIVYTPLDGENDSIERKSTSIPSVGSVHLGLIYMLEVPEDVTIRDNEGMINPEFIKISDASKGIEQYETWSQMILETLTDMKRTSNE